MFILDDRRSQLIYEQEVILLRMGNLEITYMMH